MRWLYHVALRTDLPSPGADYAPASLGREGFIHASYRDAVRESARLYFPPGADVVVLRIDPRRLGASRLEVAETPRGPMPHVHGPLRPEAIAEQLGVEEAAAGPDQLDGTG